MTIDTKDILKALSNEAKNPSPNKLHVIPSMTKGWSVVPDHRDRAVRVLPSRKEAIEFAKNYIETGEIEIHNSDGTLSSMIIIR